MIKIATFIFAAFILETASSISYGVDDNSVFTVTTTINDSPPASIGTPDSQDRYYTVQSNSANLKACISMDVAGESSSKLEFDLGKTTLLKLHATRSTTNSIEIEADIETDGISKKLIYQREYASPVTFRYYQQSGKFYRVDEDRNSPVDLDFIAPYRSSLERPNKTFSTSFGTNQSGVRFLKVNNKLYSDPGFKSVQITLRLVDDAS